MRKINFYNHGFYHVYNRGTEKRQIYLDDRDRLRFINSLIEFNDIGRSVSYSSLSERSPLTLKVSIGRANGLYFVTSGSSASRGSLSFIRSIFSLMPRAAKFMSVPQLNSTVTMDVPSREVEITLLAFLVLSPYNFFCPKTARI